MNIFYQHFIVKEVFILYLIPYAILRTWRNEKKNKKKNMLDFAHNPCFC